MRSLLPLILLCLAFSACVSTPPQSKPALGANTYDAVDADGQDSANDKQELKVEEVTPRRKKGP